MRTLPRLFSDTGQKKTPEKKYGRRMSFQKPKGTIEYSVESRDSLNNIALKFDTTPNELVQLNKLFSRAVVAGQILYVPDPEYISSVESSPSLSPISPLSPTSSEAELEKVTGVFTLGLFRGFAPYSVQFGTFGVKCEQQSLPGKRTVPSPLKEVVLVRLTNTASLVRLQNVNVNCWTQSFCT
ncbi:UNVERIFIED_CONTAM: hypothetical protein FKN15_067231 [Acipenser sinensis]